MMSDFTQRTIAVLAHIEIPCGKCGRPWWTFGIAEVLPNGRIGKGRRDIEADRLITCDECRKLANKEVNKQNRDERIRRKFLEKKPTKGLAKR